MNAELVELVQDIEERGLSVSVTGGDLRLQGMRDRMDPELVGRIKRLKAELIQHLSEATPHESGSFPLTPLQHAYLLGRGGVFEISTASHVYHEIEGHWDVGRLETALNAVIGRPAAICRMRSSSPSPYATGSVPICRR